MLFLFIILPSFTFLCFSTPVMLCSSFPLTTSYPSSLYRPPLLPLVPLVPHLLLLLILLVHVLGQLLQHLKLKAESGGLEPGVEMSPIEEQYVLNEYGVLLGTLTVRTFALLFGVFVLIRVFLFYSLLSTRTQTDACNILFSPVYF